MVQGRGDGLGLVGLRGWSDVEGPGCGVVGLGERRRVRVRKGSQGHLRDGASGTTRSLLR